MTFATPGAPAAPLAPALPPPPRARWGMLALLAVGQLFGMSLWLAGSAVAPELSARWGLDSTQAGWLASAVQLGFVAGTAAAALLNLADTLPSRVYFAVAALAGAACNGAFAAAPGFESALVFRFLTGACLAGVYPPAMKMAATWFAASRGLAIGTIVGALTAGKASPYLVRAIPDLSAPSVVLSASAAALVAAALILAIYRDGPHPFPRRPFSWGLAGVVWRSREYRLVLGGYAGHMLELYSYWVWIPAFLAASVAGQGVSPALVSLLSFGAIAIGAVGGVWGGAVADRIGYVRLVIAAMFVSGTCALLSPLFFGGSIVLLALLVGVWGMAVIADSAQFSTLVTKVVPPHAVGTALTLQTSIGFLLTTISIQLVPPVVDAVGWRWAFPMLALGPALGIAAIRRLGTGSGARL